MGDLSSPSPNMDQAQTGARGSATLVVVTAALEWPQAPFCSPRGGQQVTELNVCLMKVLRFENHQWRQDYGLEG